MEADRTLHLAKQLEILTGLESRVTILGHLQRGGIPSAADRLLATRLGAACAEMVNEGRFGVMVAARGDGVAAVALEDVAGRPDVATKADFAQGGIAATAEIPLNPLFPKGEAGWPRREIRLSSI